MLLETGLLLKTCSLYLAQLIVDTRNMTMKREIRGIAITERKLESQLEESIEAADKKDGIANA